MAKKTIEEIELEIAEIKADHVATTQYNLYRGQNLDEQDFSGQDLTGCNFRDCSLFDANFEDAILHFANFKGSNMTDVKVNFGTKTFDTPWVDDLIANFGDVDNNEPQWMKDLVQLQKELERLLDENSKQERKIS